MQRFFQKMAGICLTCFLLIGLVPFAAQAEQSKLIRVGFSDFPGFSEIEEDGTYTGYNYEYLCEMARYTGWDIEIVFAKPEELFSLFEKGEIDMAGGILKNDQTVQLVDFPEYNSGMTYATLITSTTNFKYDEDNYQSFNGMRVGVRKTATRRIAQLDHFCSANSIALEQIPYESEEALSTALKSGEVDAVLSGDLVVSEETRLLAKFSPAPFYFAVAKNKSEILNEVNMAISKINEVNVHYDTQLYQRCFPASKVGELFLSEQEQEYIQNLGTLTVVSTLNAVPVEYFNEDETYAGITADLLNLIAEKTNLKFNVMSAKTQEEALDMLQNGKADMITGLFERSTLTTLDDVSLTVPYLSPPMVLVKRVDQNSKSIKHLPVAVLKGYFLKENMLEYPSPESCMEAVHSQKAGYCLVDAYSAEHYQRKYHFKNLSLVPVSGSDWKFCFGISKKSDTIFRGIVNKAIYHLTEDERQDIIFNNTSAIEYSSSLEKIIHDNPVKFSFSILILFLLLTAFALFFLKKKSKIELQAAERYRILADISDETLFEYQYEKDILIVSENRAKDLGISTITEHFSQQFNDERFHIPVEKIRSSQLTEEQYGHKQCFDFPWTYPDHSKKWFRCVYVVKKAVGKMPTLCIGKLVNIDSELYERNQLLDLARRDGLTNLLNKAALEQSIADFLRNQPFGTRHALLVIDVDYFKSVNDNYGHQCGDDALRAVGNSLKSVFRSTDILGRIGGDEFVVLAKNIHTDSFIEQKLQLLLETPLTSSPKSLETLQLSYSIGGAFYGKDGTTYEDLFKKADLALYDVKRNGRNGFSFYTDSL